MRRQGPGLVKYQGACCLIAGPFPTIPMTDSDRRSSTRVAGAATERLGRFRPALVPKFGLITAALDARVAKVPSNDFCASLVGCVQECHHHHHWRLLFLFVPTAFAATQLCSRACELANGQNVEQRLIHLERKTCLFPAPLLDVIVLRIRHLNLSLYFYQSSVDLRGLLSLCSKLALFLEPHFIHLWGDNEPRFSMQVWLSW